MNTNNPSSNPQSSNISETVAPVGVIPGETVLILDFGSQYSQLIARRIREAGAFSILLAPNT